MYEQLTLPGCEEWVRLTPSSAGSPARTSPWPARVWGLRASDLDCGSSICGSCKRCDPIGFSLRTSLVSALEALTRCSLVWTLAATPAGLSWWVLTTLGRRTDASGCGSWPTAQVHDWPTADSFNRKSQKALTASTENGRRSGGGNSSTLGLEQAVALEPPGELPPPERQSPALRRQVETLWPTASATPYGTNQGGGAGRVGPVRPSLEGMARESWATASARDWRDGRASEETHAGNSRPLNEQVTQLENFPTPKAADGRTKGTGGTADHGLDAMARAGLLDQESPSTTGKPRGCLNSAWVAQLMGFPQDWCELPDDETSSR